MIMARSRTINIRVNNKAIKDDELLEQTCRWCNEDDENEDHIMGNCMVIKDDMEWRPYANFFKCNTENEIWALVEQVKFIEDNIKTLEDDNSINKAMKKLTHTNLKSKQKEKTKK